MTTVTLHIGYSGVAHKVCYLPSGDRKLHAVYRTKGSVQPELWFKDTDKFFKFLFDVQCYPHTEHSFLMPKGFVPLQAAGSCTIERPKVVEPKTTWGSFPISADDIKRVEAAIGPGWEFDAEDEYSWVATGKSTSPSEEDQLLNRLLNEVHKALEILDLELKLQVLKGGQGSQEPFTLNQNFLVERMLSPFQQVGNPLYLRRTDSIWVVDNSCTLMNFPLNEIENKVVGSNRVLAAALILTRMD